MAARSLFIPLLTLVLSVSAWSSRAYAELATALVTREDGSSNYAADGVIEAVQHAEVAAQVPGRITRVMVKAGDRVRAGTLLASIDARAAQDQQAAARAQLQAAQRDYERSRELFAQNYISKAAMDRVEAQYRVLQAQLNIADTQIIFIKWWRHIQASSPRCWLKTVRWRSRENHYLFFTIRRNCA